MKLKCLFKLFQPKWEIQQYNSTSLRFQNSLQIHKKKETKSERQMDKKTMSRSYQENLLLNLIEQCQEMDLSPDMVVVAKKILVSIRYFMTNFNMDDDIIDEMSMLVDRIMEKLNMGMAIPAHAQATTFATDSK